jgi:universal stress protein E
MDKVTRILAVAENPVDGIIVLDKAVTTARCLGAQVELLIADVAHVQAFAERCLSRHYDCVTLSRVRRGHRPMHETILGLVFESPPDIVFKAPAGAHPLKRWSLDANDCQLVNECPVPILLVRPKPWAEPVRFAAAVDISDKDSADLARSILQAAGFLALGCQGSLDILYSERERRDELLRMENAVKLAQLVREFRVGCEHIQMLSGAPEQTLPPLVAARHYDVLALGAQTRRPMLKTFFGTLTNDLLEAGDGDVLLVKASSAGAHHVKDSESSGNEKRLHQAEQLV